MRREWIPAPKLHARGTPAVLVRPREPVAMSAADIIRSRLLDEPPDAAIILGSSLDPVTAILDHPLTLDYTELPGFPVPKVSGHAGKIAAGRIGSAKVLVLRGRAHPYENGDAAVM